MWPGMSAQSAVADVVDVLVTIVEACGAAVIAIGAIIRHLVIWSLTNSGSVAIGNGAAVDSRAALARISKALAPLPLRTPPLDD